MTQPSRPGDAPGIAAWLAIAAIRVYQLTFSAILGRSCRFLPTCSEYAQTAIARHGLWTGGWLAAMRIGRCRPGGGHGFDPVPDTVGAHGLRFWELRRYACGNEKTPAENGRG